MYEINDKFTEGEMWALISALELFMYDNLDLTEEQYELCESAREKIMRDVI